MSFPLQFNSQQGEYLISITINDQVFYPVVDTGSGNLVIGTNNALSTINRSSSNIQQITLYGKKTSFTTESYEDGETVKSIIRDLPILELNGDSVLLLASSTPSPSYNTSDVLGICGSISKNNPISFMDQLQYSLIFFNIPQMQVAFNNGDLLSEDESSVSWVPLLRKNNNTGGGQMGTYMVNVESVLVSKGSSFQYFYTPKQMIIDTGSTNLFTPSNVWTALIGLFNAGYDNLTINFSGGFFITYPVEYFYWMNKYFPPTPSELSQQSQDVWIFGNLMMSTPPQMNAPWKNGYELIFDLNESRLGFR